MIGGHTIIDPELKYGMAVTGVIHPDRVIRNVGVSDGDALVLTKPLGTGIVTTALKQRKASRAIPDAAVALDGRAQQSGVANHAPVAVARVFRRDRASACSDTPPRWRWAVA